MPMSNTIDLEEVDPDSWSAVANDFADYSFEQSGDYVRSMAEKSGASARFFVATRAGVVIGGAAARIRQLPLVKRGVAYISAGPLTMARGQDVNREQMEAVIEAVRHRLVDQDGHALYLRLPAAPPVPENMLPDFASLSLHSTRRVRSYRTIVVNIAGEEAALRARLAGKWRTDLKYAQKAGLKTEIGTGAAFAERFVSLFGEMHQAKNFDVHVDPRQILALSPQSTGLAILIASKDGQDAAGHVVSMLGATAVYLFGATNELGRATKAGYLLNWESILHARQRGLSWYDLGGIDPTTNPGGYRFKKRLGGEDLTAPGPFEALPATAFGALFNGLLRLRDARKSAGARTPT